MGNRLINMDRVKSCWKITIQFPNGFNLVFNGVVLRFVDLDKWVCSWVHDHVEGVKCFTYLAEKYHQSKLLNY